MFPQALQVVTFLQYHHKMGWKAHMLRVLCVSVAELEEELLANGGPLDESDPQVAETSMDGGWSPTRTYFFFFCCGLACLCVTLKLLKPP